MGTWNRLVTIGGKDGGGEWWKGEEGTSQRTSPMYE